MSTEKQITLLPPANKGCEELRFHRCLSPWGDVFPIAYWDTPPGQTSPGPGYGQQAGILVIYVELNALFTQRGVVKLLRPILGQRFLTLSQAWNTKHTLEH